MSLIIRKREIGFCQRVTISNADELVLGVGNIGNRKVAILHDSIFNKMPLCQHGIKSNGSYKAFSISYTLASHIWCSKVRIKRDIVGRATHTHTYI